jgi:hypothetical protein
MAYLQNTTLVATACALHHSPNRRTLDRRLQDISAPAEAQIQALGLVLALEAVTDATAAASGPG